MFVPKQALFLKQDPRAYKEAGLPESTIQVLSLCAEWPQTDQDQPNSVVGPRATFYPGSSALLPLPATGQSTTHTIDLLSLLKRGE